MIRPVNGVSCRQIGVADLPAVATLLCEGFPDRTLDYWRDGLQRLAAHAPPEGLPRFGYLLAAGGAVVGVLLLIFSRPAGGTGVRCNVSSWYVQPAYRTYAPLLVLRGVRHDVASYVNISPAKHTLPTIEAQGFTKAVAGCFIGMPALAAVRRGATAHWVSDKANRSNLMPTVDADLLADHARFGCLGLWLDTPDGGYPLVFRKRVLRFGRLPCAMLLYCRSLEVVERFAGPIGRALAGRGLPLLLVGTGRPLHGMPGRHFPAKLPIYQKGDPAPSGVDLSYTEAALFGL